MNWLQKISKVLEVRHIPYQIYAVLQYTTKRDWKLYERESYRDWSSRRTDAAIFGASYTTRITYTEDEQAEIAVKVMWQLPFRSKDDEPSFFDTSTGLDGMLFQGFLRLTPVLKSPRGEWSVQYDDKEEGGSELVRTPIEVAEWVEHVLKNGFTKPDSEDDGDFDNDEPDNYPQWPYPEDEFTKPETDEEMINMRDPRIRGNRMQ